MHVEVDDAEFVHSILCTCIDLNSIVADPRSTQYYGVLLPTGGWPDRSLLAQKPAHSGPVRWTVLVAGWHIGYLRGFFFKLDGLGQQHYYTQPRAQLYM